MYSWCTPTVVYDQNGDGYILYCTAGQYLYLLDARTREILDLKNLGGTIEATPAVYGNYAVVGPSQRNDLWNNAHMTNKSAAGKKFLQSPPRCAIITRLITGCGADGSALEWGSRGRWFKSSHSDHKKS